MRAIAAEPHHAGSPGSRKVADYVLGAVQVVGLNASDRRVRSADAVPDRARRSNWSAPERYVAQARRSRRSTRTPTRRTRARFRRFNAYSADGDVTADLVYVNYGMPEDYEQLAKLGVDVKGKIVIARYGRSWRGIKPKVAYEHGAVGCIIYSDPRDDGYLPGRRVPDGRVSARAGRAARQRHGHADPSRRSADAGPGVGARRQRGSIARVEATILQDSGAADLLRRRAAAAAQPEGPGGARRAGAARCRSPTTSAPARRRSTSSWRSTGASARSTTSSSRIDGVASFPTSGSSTATTTTRGSTARPIRPAATSR